VTVVTVLLAPEASMVFGAPLTGAGTVAFQVPTLVRVGSSV